MKTKDKSAEEKKKAFETLAELEAKRKEKEKKIKKKAKLSMQKIFVFFLIGMLIVTAIFFVLTRDAVKSFFLFSGAIVLFFVYVFTKKKLDEHNQIKKMELSFPDFISLMSSNLRAGMTVDRALIISARKEFAPLDAEILNVGKDILTGREISEALQDMGKRIKSEEIRKTIQLIISGIRSGGNLSVLLEKTSNNMRERIFVNKRAASNVLMYVIFIFFAVAVGAPLLFALSSVLVEIMAEMFAGVSGVDVTVNLPFTITDINISSAFIFYFCISFIIAMCIFASLIIGLVSKGSEREGMKFMVVLVVIALLVFFVSRWFLLKYFVSSFG
ncbi:MAG: type II secretion system F family protein [Nanoarchaeota archaeon]|nr:type II secretion system F family protein [Nanoarchaeota archaeon]MBU1103574.1 type II secretion system F family protein [Nanoarchaeota archaeon]